MNTSARVGVSPERKMAGGCGNECGESCASAAAAQPSVCTKCGERPAEAWPRPKEALCSACLWAVVRSKFRHGVRAGTMLAPGDSAALAYSGGPASAALLRLALDGRCSQEDHRERSKEAFELTVVHVDEAGAGALRPGGAPAAEAVAAAVAPYLGGGVRYRCVPLSDAFAEEEVGETRRAERLAELLEAVSDPTGREDLIRHLRMRLLLQAAEAAGCTKVLLGDTATALAAQVIAAAAKGRGYALAGDAQWVDARYGPGRPVLMRPLLGTGRREVEALARIQCVPLAAADPAPPDGSAPPGRSINALAAAFVAGLYEHNPGCVGNIMGVVAKLQAFPWNEPPPQRKGLRTAVAPPAAGAGGAPAAPDVFCTLCLSPLATDELAAPAAGAEQSSGGGGGAGASGGAAACQSCRDLILSGAAPSSGGGHEVVELLPRAFLAQTAAGSSTSSAPSDSESRLREHIAEFLIEE